MTNFVYPSLIGQQFPSHTVSYNTLTDEALSKRLATIGLQQYPIHTWEYSYDILRDDLSPSDIRSLVGLYCACRGRFDSFLFTDPSFNSVSGEVFGVGDGQTKDFQIVARFKNPNGPSGADIVQNFNGAPVVLDGGANRPYLLGPTGIVSFVTAPVAGHLLTWSGSFYYRCWFMSDTLQVQQFMSQWWNTKSLQFRSGLL